MARSRWVRNAARSASTSAGASTRGRVRGVRISGIPPLPRRAPGRRAARLAGTGLRRTPVSSRAHRYAYRPRTPLRGQESKHVRSGHHGRLLADDLEEHLQVVGHGQPGVGPCRRRHEHQVVVQQRMPERDLLDRTVCRRADQAWHELQRVTPLPAGDRPRHAIMSLPLDHPHIKHDSPRMSAQRACPTRPSASTGRKPARLTPQASPSRSAPTGRSATPPGPASGCHELPRRCRTGTASSRHHRRVPPAAPCPAAGHPAAHHRRRSQRAGPRRRDEQAGRRQPRQDHHRPRSRRPQRARGRNQCVLTPPPRSPRAAARRHELTRSRAIQALRELDRSGQPVTFASVAATAGISRSARVSPCPWPAHLHYWLGSPCRGRSEAPDVAARDEARRDVRLEVKLGPAPAVGDPRLAESLIATSCARGRRPPVAFPPAD
jgi:hypothetical protein